VEEPQGRRHGQTQEIGTLPKEGYDKWKVKDQQSLLSMIERLTEKLKKYGNVNKKAAEQWENFSEQRDRLLERKTEIDDSDVSVQGLIAHLDSRKEEAILATFKAVAKHFKEVFTELVPSGAATIKMVPAPGDEGRK